MATRSPAATLTRDTIDDDERRQPPAEGRGTRNLAISPRSYNSTARTVEAVLSAGTAVRRSYFTEELEISAEAIDLNRVSGGICPLLDTHNQYELSAVIGRVASVRIEGGQLIGVLHFSDTVTGRDVEARVASGELRAISIGYRVTKWQITEADANDNETWRATAWELLEASFVPVPADPVAVVRSSPDSPSRQDDDMRRNMPGSASPTPAPSTNRRGVTADMIRERCGRTDDLSRSFERQLLDDHEQEPLSERELQARIAAELVSVRQRGSVDPRLGGGGSQYDPSGRGMRQLFADALYARLSGTEAPEAARDFQHASIADLGRELLAEGGGGRRFMRAASVIDAITRAGMHTTSDFAFMVANAAERYLMDQMTANASPLRAVARRRNFIDFRTRFAMQVDGPSSLLLVPEAGEFKATTVAEGKNGSKLQTYGRIFNISRQALINDDLGAFADMSRFWARAANELEGTLLAGMVNGGGPRMDDGYFLFSSQHGNLIGTASALTVASLSAARLAMRNQKSLDGQTVLGVPPRFLVVGPAQETYAEQILASINVALPGDVNPFSGKLTLIVDPRITGYQWFLFADPSGAPVIEYGNLEGQEGLFTDTRMGFEIDGVSFKARMDIGAGAVDFRGAVMNPGAAPA